MSCGVDRPHRLRDVHSSVFEWFRLSFPFLCSVLKTAENSFQLRSGRGEPENVGVCIFGNLSTLKMRVESREAVCIRIQQSQVSLERTAEIGTFFENCITCVGCPASWSKALVQSATHSISDAYGNGADNYQSRYKDGSTVNTGDSEIQRHRCS
jgi:hypothetical protein